jgi:hypothetical protein
MAPYGVISTERWKGPPTTVTLGSEVLFIIQRVVYVALGDKMDKKLVSSLL